MGREGQWLLVDPDQVGGSLPGGGTAPPGLLTLVLTTAPWGHTTMTEQRLSFSKP